jgi:hypothetical protein
MSLKKLQKKALRELKASPQKAAMLALLGVVAAWFWAPLVLKSSAHATPAAPPLVAATPAVGVATNPVPSTVATAQGKEQMAWSEVASAIDHDPRMTPATLTGLAEERNPFAPPVNLAASDRDSAAKEEAKKKSESDAAEVEQPPAGPDDLGLVLSSTLVGQSRRAALISGRTYELGSKIRVEGEAFRLIEVEPNRIVLERDGQLYTLSIKRRKGGGRIELRPATP